MSKLYSLCTFEVHTNGMALMLFQEWAARGLRPCLQGHRPFVRRQEILQWDGQACHMLGPSMIRMNSSQLIKLHSLH